MILLLFLMVFMAFTTIISDSQSFTSETDIIRKMLARKSKATKVHEKKTMKSQNESKRLIPGGPDSRHH